MIRDRIARLWWPIRFALWLALMIPVSAVTSAIGESRQIFPFSVDWNYLLAVWAVGSIVYVVAALGWRLYVWRDERSSRKTMLPEAQEAAWRKFMKRDS